MLITCEGRPVQQALEGVWSLVPPPHNTWFINYTMYNEWKNCSVVVASVVVMRGGGDRRGFLQKSGGLLSGRFTQFPFRLLRSEKSPPFSGASPPQMSLSKKHLRMHYGHAPPPSQKQLFQSLVFFWREEGTASFSFDPVFVLMYIQFRLLFTQIAVCYLFLKLVKELNRLNLYRWNSDDIFNKFPRVVFWTTQYYYLSNDTKRYI